MTPRQRSRREHPLCELRALLVVKFMPRQLRRTQLELKLLLRQRVSRIQIEVELQNANARFAKKTELPRERVFRDELTNVGLGYAAFADDARNLKFRRCR
jgi:hypothetical protein